MPSVRAWDPAYAYELSTIIQFGLKDMFEDGKDMIHYVMLYNDNESQPAKPEGCDEGIIRGAYRLSADDESNGPKVRLLGSGPILKNVIMASEKLRDRGIATEIWSVTSYGELRRGAWSMSVSRDIIRIAMEVLTWRVVSVMRCPRLPHLTISRLCQK